MILLTPWTQSPTPDTEDLWVILFVLLVPVVGWLVLRCWSAYIEQKVEQRGTEVGQLQARTALNDRLM